MAIPYSRTIFGGVSWYGALYVVGILLGIFLGEKERRRLSLPRDTVIDLVLWAFPAGVVGARLYYALMSWEQFRHRPVSVLFIWEGGLAIYGGVLGGLLAVFLYARRKKLPFLTLVDLLTPSLLLAQAVGRWGNYFNMECYGPEIVDPAFQFFPLGVLIPSGDGYVWHMATFFYESVWNLAGFFALWGLRRRQSRPGNLFAWYLLIYGSGRFIIEQLRQDSLYVGSLRASQWLSLVFCVLAAVWLLRGCRWEKRGGFPLACGAAFLLMARWFLLDVPAGYACALAAAVALAFVALRPLEGKGRRLFWLLPLLLDAAGFLLRLVLLPDALARPAQTLLCSATLPLYLGWMTQFPLRQTEKEPDACLSER